MRKYNATLHKSHRREKPTPMNSWIQRYSSLLFFSLLFLTHFLASLSLFPTMARQSLWVGGIMAAFLLMVKQTKGQTAPRSIWQRDEKYVYPHWVWYFIIIAGLFLRSLRFWAFPKWPLFDEASSIQFALELNRHWDWRFFYTDGQIPPLLIWATGILLKVSQNYFFSLEFPNFFVSCLTLLAVFGVSRRFLSETLSFLSTAFLALGYWPIYLQGLTIQAICLPLWEMGVIFLLAETVKKGWANCSGLWIFILGAWFGLGYWTYTSWPVVTITALFIALISAKKSSGGYRILPLGAGLFATSLYFVIEAIQNGGYGTHLIGYSAFHGYVPVKEVLLSAVDYINFIFWGYWSVGIYAPGQGGFLNPLIGAFFWIGLWEIVGWKTVPWFSRWAVPLLIFFLLPGILSQNLQSFRIIQVMPLVLGLSALGGCRFLTSISAPGRPILLILLLLSSLVWDTSRLTETWIKLTNTTAQFRTVYAALKKMAQKQGPGLCFTQFKVQNQSIEDLAAAVYPFNAAENPGLDIHQTRWAALLLHPDEVIFLRKDFPGAQWLIPPIMISGDDRLDIGLIQIVPKEDARLEKWVAADQWLQKADWESLNVSNAHSYQEALQYWLNPPPFLKEDRFLQTCYWERLVEFYYWHGYENHYNLQVNALNHALTDGYPAPHLFYDLGCLLFRRKNYPESRKALETALRSDPNNPDVKYALKILKEMEK